MLMRRFAIAPLCLFSLSCGEAEPQTEIANAVRKSAPSPLPPPAPGRPPVGEAPSPARSAQGASEVLRRYFALIEAGRYAEAWALRWKGRGDSAESARAFAASFGDYAEYHANVGAAGEAQSAAGSAYADVPVQIYGRMKDGKPFSTAGTVTLRRLEAVPGAGADAGGWRIYSSD